MPTLTITPTTILDEQTVKGLCVDDVLAKLTWEAYRNLCGLVAYAHQHPELPQLDRLRDIALNQAGLMTAEGFKLVMSMAAMTHGAPADHVSECCPDIEPPMFLINPNWTRVHQVALIHLNDALAA